MWQGWVKKWSIYVRSFNLGIQKESLLYSAFYLNKSSLVTRIEAKEQLKTFKEKQSVKTKQLVHHHDQSNQVWFDFNFVIRNQKNKSRKFFRTTKTKIEQFVKSWSSSEAIIHTNTHCWVLRQKQRASTHCSTLPLWHLRHLQLRRFAVQDPQGPPPQPNRRTPKPSPAPSGRLPPSSHLLVGFSLKWLRQRWKQRWQGPHSLDKQWCAGYSELISWPLRCTERQLGHGSPSTSPESLRPAAKYRRGPIPVQPFGLRYLTLLPPGQVPIWYWTRPWRDDKKMLGRWYCGWSWTWPIDSMTKN